MKTEIILLQNEMFDNGSFECFNFWLADQDGTYQVDASNDVIQLMKPQIETAMKAGKSHLNTSHGKMAYSLVYGGVAVLEIQWG